VRHYACLPPPPQSLDSSATDGAQRQNFGFETYDIFKVLQIGDYNGTLDQEFEFRKNVSQNR